jgi:hypothetical protein
VTDTEDVLAGGVRVRLLEVPGAHTVGACLRVAAGSADDPARPWGTAHLTEHVRIAAALGGSGLHLSGRTENAETRYTVAGLAEQSEDIVRALASILDHGRFVGEGVFKAEQHAVELEARAMTANPLLLLGPLAAAAAVPAGRLADSVRATSASLARITPEHVKEFTAERYRGPGAELVVAGPRQNRARLVDTVAATLPPASSEAPATKPQRSAEPSALPSELDGLVVLTVPVTGPDPLRRSVARALAGSFAEPVARAGHAVLGRTAVTDEHHEVTVLCWRDDLRDRAAAGSLRGALADALAAAHQAGGALVGGWRATVVREHQERLFAGGSPLGRAQCALLPPALPLSALDTPEAVDELRGAASRARLWRVRSRQLHPETVTEGW